MKWCNSGWNVTSRLGLVAKSCLHIDFLSDVACWNCLGSAKVRYVLRVKSLSDVVGVSLDVVWERKAVDDVQESRRTTHVV